MASRMDKYHSDSAKSIQSRSSKNETLYKELYTNKVFTEFNSDGGNVVDLSTLENNNSLNRREQFQKGRLLNYNESSNKEMELNQNSATEVEDKRNKNYNINDILEEARKNRKNDDDLEKKRKLKTAEYNILSDLSQEKLKEYQKNKLTRDEEENLEELIHTITSNSLRKKIDDELLSDLLPSCESETIISKELLEELQDEIKDLEIDLDDDSNEEDDSEEEDKKIDDSFYTKSMDLTEEDFEFEEEDYSFLEDKKMGILPKVLIALFVLIIVAVIIYIIYNFI